MIHFEKIIWPLITPNEGSFSICDAAAQFAPEGGKDDATVLRSLNAAFMIVLAGKRHALFERACTFLRDTSSVRDAPELAAAAVFYLDGVDRISDEMSSVLEVDSDFGGRLNLLAGLLHGGTTSRKSGEEIREAIWGVFFPEAAGLNDDKESCVDALRRRRAVTVDELNSDPVDSPVSQVLFTSNILLTTPDASWTIDDLPFSRTLKEGVVKASSEDQLFWYDHPVQMGVEPDRNEILYGLRWLDAALDIEHDRGVRATDERLTLLLSSSVTHKGLQPIAGRYIEDELVRSGALKNIDVFVFTELATRRIVDEILVPAASHYLHIDDAHGLFDMFGVDGEYGRHYSFLKAIAPFWQIFVDPSVKATFKIDLDQVFPQRELVEQTGFSAFEHLKSPLWGAVGTDVNGQPVELGMIAGALVNQRDIGKSLFTPDVTFPDRALSPDEYMFFSALPQAVSTESEMMAGYTSDETNGKRRCIQRVHVTGGTNGILIDSLCRHRPFTPSFIGRAEDQAYILSTLSNPGVRLAYVHKDGLVMRHDKEGFAQEAIQTAYIGKLLGDYSRILYFSAYARMLTDDVANIKSLVDPFTGCFISKIPLTVVYLRFALKAWSFFNGGNDGHGVEFVANGVRRISGAVNRMNETTGGHSLKQLYEKEKRGWRLYYETLASIKDAVNSDDNFTQNLQRRAKSIIGQCAVAGNVFNE